MLLKTPATCCGINISVTASTCEHQSVPAEIWSEKFKKQKVKGPAGSVGSVMTACRTGSQLLYTEADEVCFLCCRSAGLIGQRVNSGTKHTVAHIVVQQVQICLFGEINQSTINSTQHKWISAY